MTRKVVVEFYQLKDLGVHVMNCIMIRESFYLNRCNFRPLFQKITLQIRIIHDQNQLNISPAHDLKHLFRLDLPACIEFFHILENQEELLFLEDFFEIFLTRESHLTENCLF